MLFQICQKNAIILILLINLRRIGNMNINKKVLEIEVSDIRKIAESLSGRNDVINMTIGEPDLDIISSSCIKYTYKICTTWRTSRS